MEIITPTPAPVTATTTATNAAAKSPEPDVETPTGIHQNPNPNPKPVSFSNGVLKRHHANHRPNAVVYKECLKNHVASLGGHALDGCGEFMPSTAATADDPSSIKCAACGCHRNFHRREPEETPISPATHHVLEYQPYHRHHPPPPAPSHRSPNSASPPPISSYPSAPHMLLALSGGGGFSVAPENTAAPAPAPAHNHARKRFRTKFTQEQKEKMHEFADKVGWKMQKRDDEMVMEFCNEIGVERGVLKVWMHNNKNTLAKKDNLNNGNGSTMSVSANGISPDGAVVSATVRTGVHVHEHGHEHSGINGNGSGDNNHNHNLGSQDVNEYENDSGTNGGGTNGSSSSS